ncbi:MAG: GNAT family N-acetyltransferase [Thermomicrobiales bacterium]
MTSLPPRIRLVPIDQENWEAVANLSVRDDQAKFITPNVWSIAESKFHDALQPTAIYANHAAVGFLMYARDPEEGNYWLYRLMIDREHQGRGYGEAAVALLINQLKRLPGCTELNVGYHHDNLTAERLYLRLGFQKTGIAPWSELTARLTWE